MDGKMRLQSLRRHDTEAWLQLLRLPNLFTVPGDPLAGALLATAATGAAIAPWRILAVVSTSLCLYGAGLILNDLVDLPVDRLARPERPLPRGAIRPRSAQRAAFGLLAAGLAASGFFGGGTLVWAAVLAALVVSYDFLCKSHRLQGSICMGSCRACSFLLGASLADWSFSSGFVAVCIGAYIGAVTWIAFRENETHVPGREVWIPAAAMLLSVPALSVSISSLAFLQFLVALIALVAAAQGPLRSARKLERTRTEPAAMRATVGAFIRGLIPWQIFLVLGSGAEGSRVAAGLIGLCWALSRLFSGKFSQS